MRTGCDLVMSTSVTKFPHWKEVKCGMASTKNRVNALRRLVRRWAENGVLEPRLAESVDRALVKLEHAAHSGDRRQIHKCLNDVARLFVKAEVTSSRR